MAYTDINSEDRLVQATVAGHLEQVLGWDSVYAWNQETFGPDGTLGRASERDAVLVRDLRAALTRLNPQLPAGAIDEAVAKLTHHDYSRSLLQHNQAFYKFIRDGVPVSLTKPGRLYMRSATACWPRRRGSTRPLSSSSSAKRKTKWRTSSDGALTSSRTART